MEINSTLKGFTLNRIQKTSEEIKLVFENTKTHKSYVLTFDGLLFETSGSALNRRVKNASLDNILGFRATTQLQQLRKDPNNYRQLYIQMEGSTDNNKLELIGASRNIRISPRRIASASRRTKAELNTKRKSSKK